MTCPLPHLAAAALLLAAGPGHGGEPAATAPQRSAWFGDLQVHTMYSINAFLERNLRTTPDDAYRYAKGEAIPHPRGGEVKLSGPPLDFLAVTDHADLIGVALPVADLANDSPRGYPVSEAVRQAVRRLVRSGRLEDVRRHGWRRTVEAAERHNEPGRFTTFIGYEWAFQIRRSRLHRHVIFEGADVPALPFGPRRSRGPEDLWDWLDRWRKQGIEALAIPHNMDKSRGLGFPETDGKGRPIDRAFAEKRLRNEPVVEIIQEKGASETHPLLSPDDEWAGFQTFRHYDGRENPVGDYYREGLGRGLAIERRIGVNPYRFGAVGGSDSKLGAGAFDETRFFKTRLEPHERGSAYPEERGGWEGYRTPHVASHGSAGLTGIWAEENTRAALFRALRRRETFATSGPRLRVRFFGGFGLARRIERSRDPAAAGYVHGVPMGGVLAGTAGPAPDFFVWALRDPRAGRLQRAQIVKGWLEGGDGEARERVFDVACSDGLQPDPVSHRCPDDGARVDPADCSTSRDKGAEALRTVWTDPDFDAEQPAFYYVRVLENPSCRWSTWDAVRVGVTPNPVLPPVIQERAWTSPIWYTPTP